MKWIYVGKGSFTVEAAILVPVFMFLILGCMNRILLFHEQMIFQSGVIRQHEMLIWQNRRENQLDSRDFLIEDQGVDYVKERMLSRLLKEGGGIQ